MSPLGDWTYTAAALAGLAASVNILAPVRGAWGPEFVSMFPGAIFGELPLQSVALAALGLVGATRRAQASGSTAARAGVAISVLTVAANLLVLRSAVKARGVLFRSLRRPLGEPDPGLVARMQERARVAEENARSTAHTLWESLVKPLHFVGGEVRVRRHVRYGPDTLNTLDVYSAAGRDEAQRLPLFVYIHGGGWRRGDKGMTPGLALMDHLAKRGWICATINYRLAPGHRFPAQLIDVKRAVAHLRTHAAEFGIDPKFVVLSGGSAGGHLAALAALTANVREYQPGFEDIDTSVQACISMYGVYELAPSHLEPKEEKVAKSMVRAWIDDVFHFRDQRERLARFWASQILPKQSREERAEALVQFSPSHVARKHVETPPPFFVIHGSHDALVSVEQARRFVEALLDREGPHPRVCYAELDTTHHAFDIVHGSRLRSVCDAIEGFLSDLTPPVKL